MKHYPKTITPFFSDLVMHELFMYSHAQFSIYCSMYSILPYFAILSEIWDFFKEKVYIVEKY